jgi:hypothetical protein
MRLPALARARALGAPAQRILQRLFPLLQRLRPKRAGPVLKPYGAPDSIWRLGLRVLFTIALGFFCLAYGFYFALTAPFLIVAFAAPVLVLALLAVWALPASATAPLRTMEFFFAAVLIGLILWPNYLALALPGMPWITMIRITGIPMALLFFVSLSVSEEFRSDLAGVLRSTAPLWAIMCVFIAMQFLTLPFSKDPGFSLNRSIIQQVNWTTFFLVAAYIGLKPGRVQRYLNLLMLLAVPIIVLSVMEAGEQELLWRYNIPSFLRVDDPVIQSLLGAHMRGALGLYRVKTTFSTALGLAEYISLLTPFAIHFAVGPYRPSVKLLSVIFIPIIFYIVRLTDSRLGVVAYLTSFLLYSFMWAILRFRMTRGDLLSSAIVYSYPAVSLIFLAAVNSSNRLHDLVFGGEAQAASTDDREIQLMMGVPKILANPIGHGSGNSGDVMGYSQGEFVTVDNYFLTLGLDYGTLGLTCFLAIFLVGIAHGLRNAIVAADHDDPELLLLMPLSIALAAFLIVKSVFSQPDNHPIYFMMLGMIAALSYRVMTAKPPSNQPVPETPGNQK